MGILEEKIDERVNKAAQFICPDCEGKLIHVSTKEIADCPGSSQLARRCTKCAYWCLTDESEFEAVY